MLVLTMRQDDCLQVILKDGTSFNIVFRKYVGQQARISIEAPNEVKFNLIRNILERESLPFVGKEIYRGSKHRAGKEHTCDLCKQIIPKGQNYILAHINLETHFMAKLHRSCEETFKEILDASMQGKN